jgi:hypothetical protein
MKAEEEYIKTKKDTDRLVEIYLNWLEENKGGNWEAEEMPKYAPVDYRIFKNGEFAFYLEVKFRSHKKGEYRLEKIPVSKYCFAYTFKDLKNRKSYLLIKWNDTAGIVDLNKCCEIDEMVARYDRGSGQDIYAMYRVGDFAELRSVYLSFNRK